MSNISNLFNENGPTVASTKRLGYVGSDVRGTMDSRNDDWYTPKEWISFAHNVLGKIDLDPFSSELANKTVKAGRFFTIEDNAFLQTWEADTVWMNPPYTRGIANRAIAKFLEEFRMGNFRAGMVLVNNMTDTRWYGQMYQDDPLFCNIIGRISFENAAGQCVSGNTRGQSLFLFANKSSKNAKIKHRFKELLEAKGQFACKWEPA